jgi:hypothetical protein
MSAFVIWLISSSVAIGLAAFSSRFHLGSQSPKLKLLAWSFVCLFVSIIAGDAAKLPIAVYATIGLYVGTLVVINRRAIKEDAKAYWRQHFNCFKKS